MNKKPNQQAAEKRKREEALLTFCQDGEPVLTFSRGDDPQVFADECMRIWIGTGDAGEPNE